MDWFYVQMVQMHSLLAWLSAALFVVRGLAALFDAKWRMDIRLLSVAFLAYGMLALSGLSLWALMHHNPIYDAWLAMKLIALLLYAVCAHWAIGYGRYRAVGYAISVLMLAYILLVSTTRQGIPIP